MQRKALDSVIVSPSDGDRRARSSTNFSPFASSSSDAFGAGARIARMAWLLPQFRPLCPSDAHFWFSLRCRLIPLRSLAMALFLNTGTLAGALTASSSVLVSRSRASVVLNLRRFSSRPQKVQLFELEIDADGSSSEVEVLGMRRLEDAIRAIIVRRSAPDWLPFIPGSSYWVPPRRRHCGVVELVSRLTNPMTDEEMMSFTTARGWPSSAYFVEGTSLHPRKKSQERINVQSDDEES